MESKIENQQLLAQREIYATIFPIVKASSTEVLAERVKSSGWESEDADKVQALVDTLPEPEIATGLEMRIIFCEANAGHLETFWSKFGDENTEKLRQQYDSHGGNYSKDELLELSKSSMWPALQELRPDTYKIPQE